MLAVSGELNPRMFGVSARPKLPDRISSYAWKPDAKPEDQDRRSVYVFAKRNLRYPLFDAFDLPDMHNSCPAGPSRPRRRRRCCCSTATSPWSGRSKLGDDLTALFPSDDAGLAARAYRLAWGRPADGRRSAAGGEVPGVADGRPALARRRRRRLLPRPAEHERVLVRRLIGLIGPIGPISPIRPQHEN